MDPAFPPAPQPPPPAPASSAHPGAIRLFTFNGIQVLLHWTWLLVAVFMIDRSSRHFGAGIGWAAAEYVGLFVIVLMHEFGHAFATRQTGGRADTILLWPFGGIAYVQAPNRPSAHLWGLAAGPLVNVVLWPILWYLTRDSMFPNAPAGFRQFLDRLHTINTVLLIFNLLPIFPLDGGQILRTLLWYRFGPLRSLEIASFLGLVGGVALAGWAWFRLGSYWIPILMIFLLMKAWEAWQYCRRVRRKIAEQQWP